MPGDSIELHLAEFATAGTGPAIPADVVLAYQSGLVRPGDRID